MFHLVKQVAFAAVLAMQAVVPAAPVSAQSATPDTLTETYSDWKLSCQNGEIEGAQIRLCAMEQQLVRRLANGQTQSVLSVVISDADKDDGLAELVAITPHGVKVTQGIEITVGDTVIDTEFLTCRPVGCIMRYSMDADRVALLKAGTDAVFKMTFVGDQEASIAVSLNGFSAAFTRIGEL